jgi:oxygen-independent coproporphyrinogen-3 oxidase
MTPSLVPASAPLDVALLETISLYIHIPFCHKKCHYCDFNSYAGLLGWRTKYVRALAREIALAGRAARLPDGARRRCRTIFFGGGTPSLLKADEIAALLAAAHEAFAVDAGAEITLEANPGTLEYHHLDDLRATGVNRLSMGAQSFDNDLLRWMGRIHSADEIVTAVRAARQAGFTNLNLDFIFALPDQTLAQWTDTLDRAIALAPDHLSLYSLIVEPETPLFDWVQAGTVIPASDDVAADMYLLAQEHLAQAGYAQYEISNWARPGCQCDHNLTYWHNLPYLGVGAGAHSFFAGRRFANARPVADYVAALDGAWEPTAATLGMIGGPVTESTPVDATTDASQTAILALRLNEGLDLDHFARRCGVSFADAFGARLTDLVAGGFVEYTGDEQTGRRLRLTERGRLVGNEVFERFL